jgi:restriction system protein
MKSSPTFFEKLVVKLLVKLGYGGSIVDAGQAIGRSGDDGIDGIIKEDKLGLDVVNIQAKRWENRTVGRPEIQAFAGSLEGHRNQIADGHPTLKGRVCFGPSADFWGS